MVKIEKSVGTLKGRFTQLRNIIECSFKDEQICNCPLRILYNLCLINSDEWKEKEFYENDINFPPGTNSTEAQEGNEGRLKLEEIYVTCCGLYI